MNKFWSYFLWLILFFCLGLVPVIALYAVLNQGITQEYAYTLMIVAVFVVSIIAHLGALKMIKSKLQGS
jgi:hypothetical protein